MPTLSIRRLAVIGLLVGASACRARTAQIAATPRADTSMAMHDHATHHAAMTAEQTRRDAATQDTAFASLQTRGATAMGVDQYTSSHIFEDLPDGGRIVLQNDREDSTRTEAVRTHLRTIARQFGEGDFATPGFVHATAVPGVSTLSARHAVLRYEFSPLPRGGQVRITTSDSLALSAVREFLAFQRREHHARQ